MRPIIINLVLVGIWLLLVQYCYTHPYNYPSSYLYNPGRAYSQAYSDFRESQANAFLLKALTEPATSLQPWIYQAGLLETKHTLRLEDTRICVGIPSVQHDKGQFLGRTLASLVDSLTMEEREKLTLKVLLGGSEPQNHPAYGQAWLSNIADDVLVYGEPNDPPIMEEYHHIPRNFDNEQEHSDQVQINYATLMKACREDGADYFVLTEDGVVASEDWLKQLRFALSESEAQTIDRDWLYLRLFNEETYLSWNAQDLPVYLRYVVFIYIAVMMITSSARSLLASKTKSNSKPEPKCISPNHPVQSLERTVESDIAVVLFVTTWFVIFVLSFFVASRVLVSPLQSSVHETPTSGCYTQGLAIPHRHLELLEENLLSPPRGIARDAVIETLVDRGGFRKLVLVPSVLQHVGMKGGASEGSFGRTRWNFSFEKGQSLGN